MLPSERYELRAIIKFCTDLGKSPTDTLKLIKQANRKSAVGRSFVFKWHRRFTNGQVSLEEEEGRGRKKLHGVKMVTSIRSAVETDRRLTVRELAERYDVGYGTVHRILTEELKMSKVSLH